MPPSISKDEARRENIRHQMDIYVRLFKQIEQCPSERVLNEPEALVELIAAFLEWMMVIGKWDFGSEEDWYNDPRDCVSFLASMLWRTMKPSVLSLNAVHAIKRLPVNGDDLLEICDLFFEGHHQPIDFKRKTMTYEQTIEEAKAGYQESIRRMQDLKFVATEYLRLSKPSKRPNVNADLMRRVLFEFADSDTETILREFKKQRIVNGKPKGIRRAVALKLIREIQSGEI